MQDIKLDKGLKGKKTEEVKASDMKYGLDDLRKNCLTLFNVSTSVFDGAVMGLAGKYTISEIKSIITKWKDKEVL